MPVHRRLPLFLAAIALAAAVALVPGRASADSDSSGWAWSAGDLWVGPASVSVDGTTAVVRATIDPKKTTTVWFEYGTTTAYESRTPTTTLSNGYLSRAEATLTGLDPHTTFYVRVVADNGFSRETGSGTRFVTGAAAAEPRPQPQTADPLPVDVPIELPIAHLPVKLPQVDLPVELPQVALPIDPPVDVPAPSGGRGGEDATPAPPARDGKPAAPGEPAAPAEAAT
ncbi:MAG TPA: fibronectin type III domain-containing protein, partial [Solirubrobacteraceae bacterium]|nr:fibronectin type III domain-containing protein [Solirubrobacteraceae bacterium]